MSLGPKYIAQLLLYTQSESDLVRLIFQPLARLTRDVTSLRSPKLCQNPRLYRLHSATTMPGVPHLMTLADLTAPQINRLIAHSHTLKQVSLPWLAPQGRNKKQRSLRMPSQSLFNKSIALLFSKRSTRTRLSAETAAGLLGGRSLFLGREDIQLGVNESPRDTARVIGGMCEGIFARVGEHEEIEVCILRWMVTTFCLTCRNAGIGEILTRSRPQRALVVMAPNPDPRRCSHPARKCAPLRLIHQTAHCKRQVSTERLTDITSSHDCLCR